MTQHVTIALDEPELSRARALAEDLGVSVEEYLQRLVSGHLPQASSDRRKTDISAIFDLGESSEPNDISKDKHRLIGEAVWQEHLSETAPK